MPWKLTTKQEQRFDLVRQMQAGQTTVAELCRCFKISRVTAYKWLRRFRTGRLRGLKDRSRRPRRLSGRTNRIWLERIRRLRQKRKTWGARKLCCRLAKCFGKERCPSVATVSRWLKRWGLAKGKRRIKNGPTVLRAGVKPARHCNDIWTVDFKGWFRTGDGRRVDPLTVRDLYSRYGLRIGLLGEQTVEACKEEFIKIFKQYGLPRRIRCDNGAPFGGGGPTGLTRLSAWWIKLGIRVEFIRPGCPYENGAHEQYHRVYKAEVAKNPARTPADQQQRTNRWLRDYNGQRPHEGLGMKVPAAIYQRSGRQMPVGVKPWKYPPQWIRRWVKGNGQISWQGNRRFIGEAFIGDYIGMKPAGNGKWRVYYGPLLIGQLNENESGAIRPARYRRAK